MTRARDLADLLNGGKTIASATISGDLTVANKIQHDGDTDSFIQFDGADSLNISTGGGEKILINNTGMTVNEDSADLDFRVESNGNANMLFVDGGNNRVGIGTNSPQVEAHIQTSSGNPELRIESTGANYASMSLENSSRRYSTQIRTDQSNAYVIRDETGGANRFLIDTSGNIMMNTTSVGGTSILSLGSSNYMVATHNDGGTSGFFGQIRFRNNANNADVGTINRVNDASVQYNTTSDARLKENIADMTGAIARVEQLSPKRYSWVNEELDAADQDGFLAHEAQAVVPIAVSGTQDEVDEDGNPVYMQMDYSKLVPLLTGALQEAITKIETLETEMTALKARVTTLEGE